MSGTNIDALIRDAIGRSGLTRAELSRRANVPYSVVHKYCENSGAIQLDTASRLVRGLGLTCTLEVRKDR